MHCTHKRIAQWIGDEYTSASLCISDRPPPPPLLFYECRQIPWLAIASGGVRGADQWHRPVAHKWRRPQRARGELRREDTQQRQRCEKSASSSESANGPSQRPPLHVNVSPSESPQDPPIVKQTRRHAPTDAATRGARSQPGKVLVNKMNNEM